MSCDEPKTMQKELLDKYVQEHGKAPLWNASKKKFEKIQKIATAKSKSSAVVSSKDSKVEKKLASPAKDKAPIKLTTTKSTIPPKVAIAPKSTEPSSSPSSIHTGTDSAQKAA
jgi:hypothetical protein